MRSNLDGQQVLRYVTVRSMCDAQATTANFMISGP